MAREIVHIPARRGLSNRATVTDRKIRVAAYCRVSTDHEEQINSFENQVTYYTEYINRNPNYELVTFMLMKASPAPTPDAEMISTA